MASNTTTEIFDGATNFSVVCTATVPAVLPDIHGVANTLLHPQLWQALMSKHRYVNRHDYISNTNIKTFKKNAPQCNSIVEINDNLAKSKLNLTKADNIIIAVISQINNVASVRDWVIDSGATRHICANKNEFLSYTQVEEGEETIYLGDSRTTRVLGKEKFFSNSHLVKL
ncbi:hypothetical protein A4A49_62523 [Nicotiana attenuata]|uniref:Retrovirus-related Pol polyprotein from transposon TNT 1-94-like beta-barrel domain-containing protein n=1 Tax=Nicotiana attenuata TaxID=49451 RepID=A0A1J6IB88_NICAT|nr:hypothetical protein A4A49_62523 [Nicotiana attenuata]